MCAKSRRGNFYESAIFLGKSAKSELQTTILTEFRIPSKEGKTNKGWLSGNPFGFNFNSSSWLKQMCCHIIWVLLVTSEDYWEVARIGAWEPRQPLLNLRQGDIVSRSCGWCGKKKKRAAGEEEEEEEEEAKQASGNMWRGQCRISASVTSNSWDPCMKKWYICTKMCLFYSHTSSSSP